MPRFAHLAAVAAVAACLCTSAYAHPVVLHFQVEPQQETCLHENLVKGQDVEATAMVYRGGKLDIKLRISGLQDRIEYEQLLFSNIDDATGKMMSTIVKKGHRFTAPDTGTYAFCLDNRMARWTAKVVTFELEVLPGSSGVEVGDVFAPAPPVPTVASTDTRTDTPTGVAADTIRTGAHRILGKLQMIENAQWYHYQRETRHRETLSSTHARVYGWAMGQAGVVITTAVAMLVIVRRWFTRPTLPGAR